MVATDLVEAVTVRRVHKWRAHEVRAHRLLPRRTSTSPIPYRDGPFDYQPMVACKCGNKAARWISWSPNNPGRWYFKCANARSGGCDFFSWFEAPTSSFMRELLNDLCDAVWKLRGEKEELMVAVQDGTSKASELDLARHEVATSRRVVGEKKAKIAVLKDRNRRLELKRFLLLTVLLTLVVVVLAILLERK